MPPTNESAPATSVVLEQAAAIVADAVQAATGRARSAAERCGCGTCRARAAETILWATAMLQANPADA